eukprot:4233828-Amphidinium_carterae.2
MSRATRLSHDTRATPWRSRLPTESAPKKNVLQTQRKYHSFTPTVQDIQDKIMASQITVSHQHCKMQGRSIVSYVVAELAVH